MQEGDIVMIGVGCPSTRSGAHQCEDWCRVCGGSAGLAELQSELATLQAKHERLLSICKSHPEHNYDATDAHDVYEWLDGLIDHLRESEGE